MKIYFCRALAVMALCVLLTRSDAQFFQKIKDKINQATGKNTTTPPAQPPPAQQNGGAPVNNTGNGLTNTPPPDINQNINDAQKAGTTADYKTARYALHQALLGLEIELGEQVLHSLPTIVGGLNIDTTKNIVASTQFGWSNLVIETVYTDGKGKQMTITIGNNPAYAGIMTMYFNNSAMMQAGAANNPNMKQTTVKGNQAMIQFDKSQGYTLFMQLGQQSMIVWKCVNYATEDEVMNSVNSFDIDGIKKLLGEQ